MPEPTTRTRIAPYLAASRMRRSICHFEASVRCRLAPPSRDGLPHRARHLPVFLLVGSAGSRWRMASRLPFDIGWTTHSAMVARERQTQPRRPEPKCRAPPARLTPTIGPETRKPCIRRAFRSRPVSRILSWMAIHLGRRFPGGSSGVPGPRRAASTGPASPCTGRGLASHRVTTMLVGSYPTVSPLPASSRALPGGLLSVPLSVGFRRLGFPQRPALRCPDFPRTVQRTPAATRPAPPMVALVAAAPTESAGRGAAPRERDLQGSPPRRGATRTPGTRAPSQAHPEPPRRTEALAELRLGGAVSSSSRVRASTAIVTSAAGTAL